MSGTHILEKKWVIKKQASRLVAETLPTSGRSLPIGPGSEITPIVEDLPDEKLRGDFEERESAKGPKSVTGSVELDPGPDKIGELMTSLLGAPVGTEQAAYLVAGGVNDDIDFDEGGGALVATIPPLTYPAGQTDADVGSLCEAIKTALEAAGAGTYAISFSRTTRLFTITQSAGSGTLNMQWTSGPNVATSIAVLIGYTADDASATTYISDAQTIFVMEFVWTPQNTRLRPLYTLFKDHEGADKLIISSLAANSAAMDFPEVDRVKAAFEVMGIDESNGGPSVVVDFSDDLKDMVFGDVKHELAGAPTSLIRSVNLTINNNMTFKRCQTQVRVPLDLIAGLTQIEGNIVIHFEDAVEREKFKASTVTSLKTIVEAEELKAGVTGLKSLLEIDNPRIKYTAVPIGEVDGLQTLEADFSGFRDSVAGYQVRVRTRVRNIAGY